MTEARTLPPSSARTVSVPLYQGSPRSGASLPRGNGPTASAVAAFGSETSLHSPAPQTFAKLIFVAVTAGGKDTALDGTSRGSTAPAASSQLVLGIPASDRCFDYTCAARDAGDIHPSLPTAGRVVTGFLGKVR